LPSRVILLFIAVFAVSWASIFVRLSEAPALACAFWRVTFSTLIIASLSLSKILNDLRRLKSSDIIKLFIPGFSLALHFGLWMESLFHTTVAISTTIVCTHPIFSALITYVKLKEKPTIGQIIGFLLALIGMHFLYIADNVTIDEAYMGDHALGIILALGGAITGGIYFAYGRIMRRHITLSVYTFVVYSSSVITLLAFMLIFNIPIFGYSIKSWTFFFLLALVPMMLGHTILNYLLKYFKVISITSAVLGEPIGATLLAMVIFNEIPTTLTVIGMVMTLSGIALVLISER